MSYRKSRRNSPHLDYCTSSISLNLGLDPPNMKAAQNATSYALCIRNPPNIRFAVFLCWGMQMSVDDVAFEKKQRRHQFGRASVLFAK